MKSIKKIKYVPMVGKLEELLDLLQIRALMSRGEDACKYYEIAKSCIDENCELEITTSWQTLADYEEWQLREVNQKIENKIKECALHIEEEEYNDANPHFTKEFIKEIKNKYTDLISQEELHEEYVGENERLKEDLKKLEDINLRLAADIQNQKRISEKEKENIRLYTNEEFVKNIIITMDTLQAALKYTNAQEVVDYEKEYTNLLEGIKLTIDKLEEIFEKNKITQIEAKGEFDPEYHQALSVMDSQDFNNNEIIETIQSGYKYNEKVIRPSMVVVCKKEG